MRRLRGRAGESRNWFQCTEHRAEHRAERTAKHTAKHTAKRTARTTRCTRRDSTRRVTSPRRTSRWACSRQTTRRLASTCPRWAAPPRKKKRLVRARRESAAARGRTPPLLRPHPLDARLLAASPSMTPPLPQPLWIPSSVGVRRSPPRARIPTPIRAFPYTHSHPRATV